MLYVGENYPRFYHLRISNPQHPPPVYFPIFSFTPIGIHHKYTMWLYIAFGSAKERLT